MSKNRNRIVLVEALGIVLLLVAVAFLFVRPVVHDIDNWGIQDWDLLSFFFGAPRAVLLDYHQFPLWNPWFCGGIPLLAASESHCLSPAFWVVVLVGVVRGLKLLIWVYLVVGLVGAYLLGRRCWGLNRTSAILAAFVFMLSSSYTLHMVVGHAWIMNYAWIPWAFMFWVKALGGEDRRSISALSSGVRATWFGNTVACAVVLVLMWFGGAPYILATTLLLLAVHGAMAVLTREQPIRHVARVLVTVVGLMLTLGAVKFLPAIEFVVEYPRVQETYCGYSLTALWYGLMGRDQSLAAADRLAMTPGWLDGVSHGMHEIGMYVGLVPLCLVSLGVAVCGRRRLAMLLVFAIFLWLSFGTRVPFSAWNVLHQLPGFNCMRVAERFNVVLLLVLALFAGAGLNATIAWGGRRQWGGRLVGLLALAAVLAVLADLMAVVSPLYREAFIIPPLKMATATSGGAFVQTSSSYPISPRGWAQEGDDLLHCTWGSHYPALLANQGIVDGYDDSPAPKLALPITDANYRGEVFLYGTPGAAGCEYWTPNVLRVWVQANHAGYVVINQNYYPGWHVRGSRKRVERVGGLLGVKVTPSDRLIELYYRPWTFVAGLAISLTTLTGLLGAAWTKQRKALRALGSGVAPTRRCRVFTMRRSPAVHMTGGSQ